MFKKGTKLYSIFGMKCPRCHEGELFKDGIFKGRLLEMHDECPHCKQPYFLEPGFFWGAMYISYGYMVAIMLTVAGICGLILRWDEIPIYIATGIVGVICFPFVLRLSRSTWINFFVHYQEKTKRPKG